LKLVDFKRTYAKEGRKISTKDEENWTKLTIERKLKFLNLLVNATTRP
jgi:hypothetical protein